MKILIVDDDALCRRVLRQILAAETDCAIAEACDSDEALELLQTSPAAFDAAFIDISMPGLCGLGLVKRIREITALQTVQIVLCTAANDRATVTRAAVAGVRHYVVKPARADVVRAKLRQIQAERAAESPPAVAAGVV